MGDLHSTQETEEVWGQGGSVFLFFFTLGLRIQSWHMQLVSHLVCTGLHVILCVKIKLMCHIAGHTDIHRGVAAASCLHKPRPVYF